MLNYLHYIIPLLIFTSSYGATQNDCLQYTNDTAKQLYSNQTHNCHYSGVQWSQNIKTHDKWCQQNKKSTIKKMLIERDKSLERCQNKTFEPVFPDYGEQLSDFIPNNWEIITKDTYSKNKRPSPNTLSPIDKIITTDFNNDGKNDIIALIGKRAKNSKLFERFILLILQASNKEYKKIHVIRKGITDELPEGTSPISAQINIFTADDNQLIIHHWVSFNNNASHNYGAYEFTYQDGSFLLSGYESEETYFNHGSNQEQTTINRKYNLLNKTIVLFDNTMLNHKDCQDNKDNCFEVIEETYLINPNTIPQLEITDVENFYKSDFESLYGIKLLKPINQVSL